jgi:hypothetical protein
VVKKKHHGVGKRKRREEESNPRDLGKGENTAEGGNGTPPPAAHRGPRGATGAGGAKPMWGPGLHIRSRG